MFKKNLSKATTENKATIEVTRSKPRLFEWLTLVISILALILSQFEPLIQKSFKHPDIDLYGSDAIRVSHTYSTIYIRQNILLTNTGDETGVLDLYGALIRCDKPELFELFKVNASTHKSNKGDNEIHRMETEHITVYPGQSINTEFQFKNIQSAEEIQKEIDINRQIHFDIRNNEKMKGITTNGITPMSLEMWHSIKQQILDNFKYISSGNYYFIIFGIDIKKKILPLTKCYLITFNNDQMYKFNEMTNEIERGGMGITFSTKSNESFVISSEEIVDKEIIKQLEKRYYPIIAQN